MGRIERPRQKTASEFQTRHVCQLHHTASLLRGDRAANSMSPLTLIITLVSIGFVEYLHIIWQYICGGCSPVIQLPSHCGDWG